MISTILAGGAVLVLVLWAAKMMFGGGRRGSTVDSSLQSAVNEAPAQRWMLVSVEGVPEFVPCYRDDTKHGFTVGSAFYPDEFVRALKHGHGIYMLASHMMMPATGDMALNGDCEELVKVDQPAWSAAWSDYDRARKRLNWSAVFERGDGSLAGLKNIATGLMVVCLLLGVFQLFSLRGQLARLADNTVVLSSQVAKFSGGEPVPVSNATLAPDPGRPTGDK